MNAYEIENRATQKSKHEVHAADLGCMAVLVVLFGSAILGLVAFWWNVIGALVKGQ